MTFTKDNTTEIKFPEDVQARIRGSTASAILVAHSDCMMPATLMALALSFESETNVPILLHDQCDLETVFLVTRSGKVIVGRTFAEVFGPYAELDADAFHRLLQTEGQRKVEQVLGDNAREAFRPFFDRVYKTGPEPSEN